MKAGRWINILFLFIALWCARTGYLVSWQLTVLPTLLAACGSLASLVPGKLAAAANAVLSIGSALALWVGTFVTACSIVLLVFGDSTDVVRRAEWDVCRLGLLGVAAFASGIAAAMSVRKSAASGAPQSVRPTAPS